MIELIKVLKVGVFVVAAVSAVQVSSRAAIIVRVTAYCFQWCLKLAVPFDVRLAVCHVFVYVASHGVRFCYILLAGVGVQAFVNLFLFLDPNCALFQSVFFSFVLLVYQLCEFRNVLTKFGA